MEITSSNFNSTLPEIEDAIENSLFVSIDCELSGLNVVRNLKSFDTPREYYKKMRTNSKDFLVMQYGLSTFRYDQKENNFKQRTYNFYIFRRPINKNIPDNRFLCQSSSIDFLIRHSFDFNKLFKDGVPYLNELEEEGYRTNIYETYQRAVTIIENNKNETEVDVIPIPENAEQFIEDVKKQIKTFLESTEKELQLPRCNAFFRRLVYQIRDTLYIGKISLETRQIERDRVLFVTKLKTPDEEKQIALEKRQEQLNELDDFVGFAKVIKSLIKSDKLIIGHNICLDFFHTVDKFLLPLPESYEEFKQISRSLFSRILDTKYMSSSEPFKDLIPSTALGQLLDTVSKKPFGLPEIVIEEPGKGYVIDNNKEHEAGFDAFITGMCFLGMWKHLGLLENRSDSKTFHSMDLLEPYMNKLFLMMLSDNQYIHLTGEDLNPSRDHVFFMTFPSNWKQSNIQELFSPFGNIFISWLDDISAYVGLYKKEAATVAYTSLRNGKDYFIQRFADRQNELFRLENNHLSVPSKKRKSSDSSLPNKTKKGDNSAINKALSKMSIKPEAMVIERESVSATSKIEKEDNAISKIFQEDNDWM